MLVQLNKCVVCGSDLKRGHNGDGCLSSSILFKYESGMGHFFSELDQGIMGCCGQCCVGVMYSEWYAICDFVVFSAVEMC